MPFGPNSRAIDSARIRCAAFVEAKKPQFVLPRVADVLPVTRIAPLPASIIAGNVSRARCNKAVVFTLKFLSRSSGSNSRMLPLTLLNAL